MLIHGTPLSIPFSGGTETEPRFWYWHGASGRRYIHSVYRPETCPPLPGAVFLAVRSLGNLRTVLGAGRFAGLWDVNIPAGDAAHWESLGANEIHVHLLSRDETEARQVAADLQAALKDGAAAPAGKAAQLAFGLPDAQNKEPERRTHSTATRTPGALAA
ncbi:hypothetical protein [Taklimakanibacter deserti]|uniref:hypothetical protein n=1 Tax=Taklimakanibacter deserti TaxID=2267839 RepID=UPI000E659174